tara:strand:- start:2069 stop:3061 length:993 start_codon:yes stop_codon:yes gene_type:complete
VPSIGSKRIAKKFFFLILFLGLIFVSFKLQFTLLQKIPVQDANQTFIVKKGDSLYGILLDLEKKYNLSSTWWIKFKYIFKEDPVIKAGRYNIFPNTSISELIERFEEGDVQLFKLAIIEGTVAKNNLINLENFIKDQKLNFDVSNNIKDMFSEEALLMPDTYFFSDQQDLIKVLSNSKLYLDEYLNNTWSEKSKDNPLQTPYEALILASIIEREAVLPSEQEKIASVFLARLEINMRLQADPTSSYGFYGDYGKKIGRAVLDDKNPYNTYQNKGLPPGPICYPSKGAIEAAIKSSPGEFFYFVAKGDGSHIFSKTYEEHNKAVKKYIYSK